MGMINKGKDNFFMAGFFIGLCTLPLLAVGLHWYAVLVYAGILSVCMGVWCKIFKTDWIEELGRGAFIILLTPILLI